MPPPAISVVALPMNVIVMSIRSPVPVVGVDSRDPMSGFPGRGSLGSDGWVPRMGDEITQTAFTRAHRQEYRRKVALSLDVFETMLSQSSFEFDKPMTGMEIECNLVDADYQPAMTNA